MNYKDDMYKSINQIFENVDECEHIKAVDYKDLLFNCEIDQNHNELFHQIRKHKLSILDEIIEETEMI